jgi:hypothetical protein
MINNMPLNPASCAILAQLAQFLSALGVVFQFLGPLHHQMGSVRIFETPIKNLYVVLILL